MGQGGNNLLALLRELSAHPERANSALKLFEGSAAGLEKDAQAMREHTAEVLKATKAQEDGAAVFARLHLQGQTAVVPIRQMHEAFRLLTPEITRATSQAEQHSNAVQRAALALRTQTAAGVELASKGLVGLIAGRRAQAGVEAVWETARGIACIAEGTWPPNPAAIVAAGLHFEAAAQYALLAGSSSHRHSAAGGGGAGGYEGGGYGAGESPYGPAAQALAPGAAAPSPRVGSGVVIIRGTQAFEDYVAGAVNGAVARGVTVTSTQSQRGAPVGH